MNSFYYGGELCTSFQIIMFLKEFKFNLKSFQADFKFHYSCGKKRRKTINSEKMGKTNSNATLNMI